MFKDFIDAYEDTQTNSFDYTFLNTVDDFVATLNRLVKGSKLVTSADMKWLGHRQREDLADQLTERFVVKVNRFGTGNGKHSGILPGCGVSPIHIRRRK